MNCECNNNSNRVEPRIKHVYGNVLRMAIPLTLRTLVKDGDEMIVNDTDFIPSSDHLVRVVFSKGKTNYPIVATMDGNVAIIEDKGKIPVGTYDISVECYDDLGNPYRFKQNAVLYVTDTTADAGIDEEIEYEAQTWYLNAAVFLATTEIGEIGDVIDTKLEDVFGNAVYDANAKEIRFYNKGNSRVLATIDSRPFIVDGTVADVYIDVSRQVLVVVLNEDAGGRRFSVPLYLVFAEYYKKDEVDSLVFRTVEGVRFDFSQELPLVVPVTKNGSSISSSIDYGAIDNAIREDGRLVVACVNNANFYQLLTANGMEVAFSRVTALDGYQELLIVNESNVWSMEDVDLGTGGGAGYEPPVGGIPKTDLASDVQTSLGKADTALQSFTETDPTVPSWAKAESKPTYTAQEVGALPASTTIPTKVSDLTNDSGFTSNAGTITGITMNGASKGTSGVVDLGTVITAHQDISGKANASDVYTKTQTDTLLAGKQDTLTFDSTPTAGSNNPVKSGGIKTALDAKANAADVPTNQDMADAIDDALGDAQVTVVPVGSIGVISSLGSDSDDDALSASMGKKLKAAIITILNSIGNYAFPEGKPVIDWGDDSPVTYTVQKTIGTGLSATGGDTDVALGDSLEVTIAITDNLYIIDDNSVVVTMGGQPVAGAWNASTMKVSIAAVTGNVVIIVPSLTYVGYGEQNSPLAFMLDCKNRGNQNGHWIDLIGNIDFTLGSAVTAADSGVAFDGSTNSYGETNSVLNIAPSAGTIEAVVLGASGEYNPIFINPVASGDNDNIGLCIYNYSTSNKIATMCLGYPSMNQSAISAKCSISTGSVTDFALSLSNQRYMNKGVTSVPNSKYAFLMNTAHTKLTLGRSRRPASDSRGDVVFVGTIKAIRVYSGVLTETQQLQNWKVDQKRFNIS